MCARGIAMLALAAAIAAPGCVISGDDSTEPPRVIIDFALSDVDGTSVACTDALPTVELIVQPIDPTTEQATGTPTINLFDCTATTGDSDALAPGQYSVSIALLAADGSVFATSLAQLIDLTTDTVDSTVAATIFLDGGYFELAWTFDGATATCNDIAGIANVQLLATDTVGSGQTFSSLFDCDSGLAGPVFTADPVVAGTYAITLQAIDATSTVIGTPTAVGSATITAPNGVTSLGTVDITTD